MERISIFGELSAQKQKNVREAYNRPNLGDILIVIDDTAFRGCRDGLILTENFIATKEAFVNPNYYGIEHLQKLECFNKKLFLNGEFIYKFTLVEQSELDKFVEFINNELISGRNEDDCENNASLKSNKDDKSQREISVETETVESTPQGLRELLQLREVTRNTWTVLIGRASDGQNRSQITAQRDFILEIMQLCAEWHNTLSHEARKLSDEENLFQYDLCCYLPALTYAAAHMAYLLEFQARYNYEQTVRYVQFPFAIMKFISDKHKVKDGSSSSIALVARKNESPILAECENRYQKFLCYLRKDFLFGDSYVFFAADTPWAVHMDEDSGRVYYERRGKAIGLLKADGFIDFVEDGLAAFEKQVESALLKILREYGQHNNVPHDLNLIKPSWLGVHAKTEGMRRRVRV